VKKIRKLVDPIECSGNNIRKKGQRINKEEERECMPEVRYLKTGGRSRKSDWKDNIASKKYLPPQVKNLYIDVPGV
jgi:hypothetical protein